MRRAAQIDAVRSKLVSMPEVKSVKFVSKEDALEIMRKRSPQLLEQLAGNPLPPSYQVIPQRAEDVGVIAASLETKGANGKTTLPAGVEKVNYGKKTADRVLSGGEGRRRHLRPGQPDPDRRLGASDREHDPPLDLLAAARGRGDEARRARQTGSFAGRSCSRASLTGLVGSIAAVVLLIVAKEVALPSIIDRTTLTNDEVSAMPLPAHRAHPHRDESRRGCGWAPA